MTQAELFPVEIDITTPGAIWWAGNWQCRNFNGWLQSREGGIGPWRFQVQGFSGPEDGDGEAWVYTVSGKQPCPIDRCNRILIDGRRYGRSHWNGDIILRVPRSSCGDEVRQRHG